MQVTYTGEIRKVVIGKDPLSAMSYEVGKEHNIGSSRIKVTRIVEDHTHFYIFGTNRFIVYVMKDGEEKIWKYFDDMPVLVECVI